MKRTLTQQLLAAAVLALGLNAGVSQAAPITYTYDNAVANWYATGWTATCNAGGGYIRTNTATDYLNQIRVDEATTIGGIPSVIWSGAQWTAPAGQFITQVDLTYAGIINSNGGATLAVYAGTSAATAAEKFVNLASLTWESTSATLTFSATDQYAFVQVRNWDFAYGGNAAGAGWYSTVSAATITTIPEPVSLSLLALGGVVLFRRRR